MIFHDLLGIISFTELISLDELSLYQGQSDPLNILQNCRKLSTMHNTARHRYIKRQTSHILTKFQVDHIRSWIYEVLCRGLNEAVATFLAAFKPGTTILHGLSSNLGSKLQGTCVDGTWTS